MVIGAGNALATTDYTEAPALCTSITPIGAAQAVTEPCLRKVRVVYYSGYGAGPAACGQTR